jgi:hypothetical protein
MSVSMALLDGDFDVDYDYPDDEDKVFRREQGSIDAVLITVNLGPLDSGL